MKRNFSTAPAAVILLTAILAVLGSWFSWFSSFDQLFYDFLVRQHLLEYPDDVVIVEIDEESLGALGAWPWSRRHHAELLGFLKDADAVVFDILFSEEQSLHIDDTLLDQDDTQENTLSGDLQFESAIKKNKNVFLPVFIESQEFVGFAQEVLPIPSFVAAAAGLGHVNIDYEDDGLVRGVYLHQGLGSPFWPQLVLALAHQLDELALSDRAGGNRAFVSQSDLNEGSTFAVVKSSFRRTRFIGRAESLFKFSYKDVLEGAVPASYFEGKRVFIGATAKGLGDDIPTPLGLIPGVEFQANIYQAIRNNGFVYTVPKVWTSLLTGCFVLLACLVLSRLAPSRFLLGTIAASMLFALCVMFLFGLLSYWFKPAALLVSLAIFYPLWSWRRIEMALDFLREELEKIKSKAVVQEMSVEKIAACMADLKESGVIVQGEIAASNLFETKEWPEYTSAKNKIVSGFRYEGRAYQMSLESAISVEHAVNLVSCLLSEAVASDNVTTHSYELVEQTIEEIYQARSLAESAQLRMNHSMMRLQDAVLVADFSGAIVFENSAAKKLFASAHSIHSIFSLRKQFGDLTWSALLRRLMLDGDTIYQELDGPDEMCILCQAANVRDPAIGQSTMIFVFTDVTRLRQLEQSKKEALAFLSHDMRSPIVSQLALIENHRTENPKGVCSDISLLEKLAFFAEKSLKYSDDFLQLSRAESLDHEQFQLVDMHGVVDAAYSNIIGIASNANVSIVVKRINLDCWIQGDAQLLERAVTNVLSNAVQHSPSGGVVKLSLELQGEAMVRIVDQGDGIDELMMPRLFEPYFRASKKTQNKTRDIADQMANQAVDQKNILQSHVPQERNYGLGLSFVHSVVTRHGGKVNVKSQRGVGTEFVLQFPLTDID